MILLDARRKFVRNLPLSTNSKGAIMNENDEAEEVQIVEHHYHHYHDDVQEEIVNQAQKQATFQDAYNVIWLILLIFLGISIVMGMIYEYKIMNSL